MSTPHSLIIEGAAGRMGRRIIALAPQHGFTIVAGIIRDHAPLIGTPIPESHTPLNFTARSSLASLPIKPSALIDFSAPDNALQSKTTALLLGIPLIVGTTGLSESTLAALREAARSIPVIVTPNTSPGVTITADALALLARALGPHFNASIVEAHHIHKKDAPSGTAKRFADTVRSHGGQLRDDQILSIRAGDIIGEHTIRFSGPAEEITITHRATSRDLFAFGALRAARWLIAKPPGWYTIHDTLAS
jgi:4-hydroxy-tetrahydrodipicolinate reductase